MTQRSAAMPQKTTPTPLTPRKHAERLARLSAASVSKRSKTLALAGISEKILLSKPHAAALIDMSLRTLEAKLARGEIQGLKVGSRHMVPRAALDAWLARQVAEQLGDVLDA